MKVVIAGAGNVGRFVAEELQRSGDEVVLVDSNAEIAKHHGAVLPGVGWIVGDACEVGVIARAGMADADVCVAVTGDDEDNLVISLLAKQEFGVPRVVARVNNPRNQWMFTEMWGVDTAVSTPHLLTALVQQAISVGSLVRLLSFDHGHARLDEVTLAAGSPAVGSTVASLALPRESCIVAIVRENRLVVPRGDTSLVEGDEVLVLSSGDDDSIRAALVG